MERSPDIDKLGTALAAAQGKITSAIMDSEATVPTKAGGSYAFKYADLAAVSKACRIALSEQQIAVVQTVENGMAKIRVGGGEHQPVETIEVPGVSVTTMLIHAGQWISATLTMVPGQATPQAIGSAATYARRYGLAAICGVVQEDDDGAEASRPNPVDARKQRTVPSVPPVNGRGPTIADVQAAVVDWLGVQKDDANGIVKRIKKYLELPTTPLIAENIPKVLEQIAHFKEKGVDLNGLTDALAENEVAP